MFRCSDDDQGISHMISGISDMEFLDGTWLLAVSHNPRPELLIIDTQLPGYNPNNWRILQLPPISTLSGSYSVSTLYEHSLAGYPEFLVDPAQRKFAVFCPNELAIVIPVELLKQRIYSGRGSRYISWAHWGKEVITIDLPDTRSIELAGMKMLALRGRDVYEKDWNVEVYDLSKSAQRDTQAKQVDEEWDGKCRKVTQSQRWFDQFKKGDRTPLNTFIVGNTVVRSYVSPPFCVQSRPRHAQIIVLYSYPRCLLAEVVI